jgi:hypothetical protein
MSPRRKFLLIGGVVLALTLLAFLLWTVPTSVEAGPSYEGRTLQQWIADAESPNLYVHTQAVESLRSIGTNALPTLTRWMAHRDSGYERQFYRVLESRWVTPWLRSACMGKSEMAYECRALIGFYELGRAARPALPFLESLVRENNPGANLKAANAAGAFVAIDASQAEGLAEQWCSSTDDNLVTAGHRLENALQTFKASRFSPNPQGGANGRQPADSETNRTSGAAASRRSP